MLWISPFVLIVTAYPAGLDTVNQQIIACQEQKNPGMLVLASCSEGTELIFNALVDMCFECKMSNGWNCIAGSMEMLRPDATSVTVENLQKGDVIKGIAGENMVSRDDCEVLAVHKVQDMFPTVDHFTADHFIVRESDNAVVPYGHGFHGSITRNESIYTLTTTCDAMVNTAGVKVTSFSKAFCGRDITWKETIELTNILRDALDMAPWLNLTIYHHTNESAWNSLLLPLCDAMLKCLQPETCDNFDCEECKEVDAVTRQFIRDHVDTRYYAGISASQCRRDHASCGAKDEHVYIALVRRNRLTAAIISASVIGGAALLLFVACVVEACRRHKNRVQGAKNGAKQGDADDNSPSSKRAEEATAV
eukprot:GEMP01016061.1.p1 GENE.GEMP01016061.1~~GEMP01016061.1.p1  ORF type:complete len:364 (+),score=87.33 GEMP01016061.1:49-1140(+)